MGPYDFNGRPSQSLVDIRRLCGFKSKFAAPAIAAISAFILVSLSQAGRIIAVAGTEYRMRSPRIWGYGWLVFRRFVISVWLWLLAPL